MIKVIIVEDEDNIRKNIEYMVDWKKCGCIVVGRAWNGKEGLSLIEEANPDIVISDVKMPFMYGLEMIEKAKENFIFDTIIISGFSEFNYAKKAIHLDVFDYILKPIDYDELESVLIRLKDQIYYNRLNNTNNEVIHYSQKTKEIVDYIDDNINEKITLNELCDYFELSSTSLNNLFKSELGTTVNDYINQTKIKKSIELLKSEHYLIYEIAEMLGFNDYKYFSQVFKKYTNKTPTDFIKNK